ncbi:MAG: UDP-N-acetylmuramoyl-tripeptide--D-alanyl-D-alanine ligase [Clostridia bacterium]|nr:UDP-N-acetylmuramoyl-tripeptide--D-alanyl-D-alanine ligase [Clostridia bacterium]
MNLKASEIAKALGTVVDSQNIINRVSIDSRDVDENTLFFAIKGERFDGHDFVKDVAEKGVGAIVCHKKVECSAPVIYVEDTKDALLDLASYYKSTIPDLLLIALTGSVGKTTTKEMVACVMAQKGETLKTEGNFNNEIGMPRTLFRLEETTKNAVIEMGMDGFGQISVLTNCAKPDCAIITNIGVSHIEILGSRDGILQAKLEILEGLKKGSPVFLNGDNDKLASVKLDDYKVIFFGIENENCDVRAVDIKEIGLSTEFTAIKGDIKQKITIPTVGIHNVYDALTAFAVGLEYGVSPENIAKGLRDYTPSGMRQRIKEVNGITFIEDCYNASPDSQKAGLNSLCKIAKGKKIAVLGDMLELGSFSEEAHRMVGEYASECGVDVLYTVGKESKYMADSALKSGLKNVRNFTDKKELTEILINELHKGDTILFKASRGMKLEDIFENIYKQWDVE